MYLGRYLISFWLLNSTKQKFILCFSLLGSNSMRVFHILHIYLLLHFFEAINFGTLEGSEATSLLAIPNSLFTLELFTKWSTSKNSQSSFPLDYCLTEQAVSTTQVEDDDDFQFPPFFPVVVLCPKENQPLHCIKNIYMCSSLPSSPGVSYMHT